MTEYCQQFNSRFPLHSHISFYFTFFFSFQFIIVRRSASDADWNGRLTAYDCTTDICASVACSSLCVNKHQTIQQQFTIFVLFLFYCVVFLFLYRLALPRGRGDEGSGGRSKHNLIIINVTRFKCFPQPLSSPIIECDSRFMAFLVGYTYIVAPHATSTIWFLFRAVRALVWYPQCIHCNA